MNSEGILAMLIFTFFIIIGIELLTMLNNINKYIEAKTNKVKRNE